MSRREEKKRQLKEKSKESVQRTNEMLSNRPEEKAPVRVELPAFLKTIEISNSTRTYLIQHYGGQLKSMEEWQAVIDGIRNNPVS